MFIFGKASDNEIKEMKYLGWDVEEVNIAFFNKCLEPDCDHETGEVKDYDDGEKMVAVFVDQDMVDLFRGWKTINDLVVGIKKNRA